MNLNVVGLLVGLILAALVYYVAALFLPSPVPLLIALLVLLLAVFGDGFRGRL